jgi:signal peptidase I
MCGEIVRLSTYAVLFLFVLCVEVTAAFSASPTIPASSFSESDEVFQQLAELDVSSNRLMMTITGVDTAEFNQLLQPNPELAVPWTSSETESLRQSLVRSCRTMLEDETTAQLMKTQLAQFYASALTSQEAQALIAGYKTGGMKDSSNVTWLRQVFVANELRELLQTHWRAFKMPSQAMIPMLLPGDHFTIKKTAYQEDEPKRGDIIAFRFPEDETKIFVKRVVGLPQDRLEIRDKQVYVNGRVLMESYVQHTDPSILAIDQNPRDNLPAITVPANAYFVMGDNRESSMDSRFWGYVSKDKVLGKAMFIYWSMDPNTKVPRWDRLNQPVH